MRRDDNMHRSPVLAKACEFWVFAYLYLLSIAKLPLAKDIGDCDLTNTPVNEGLVRDLAT